MKTYVSEIFRSIQGEGMYTGVTSAWIRFFTCNLQCDGFGQKDPTDPSTHILPYKDFDTSLIRTVEELPVWEYGCDSSYSWSKKFRHLHPNMSGQQIVKRLHEVLSTPVNPKGNFFVEKTNQDIDLCFTGGEPMLQQDMIMEILYQLDIEENLPKSVTVETNGTTKVKKEGFFYDAINTVDWLWSYSPKLFTVSGEINKKAIKYDVIEQYNLMSNHGQIKPVLGTDERQWDEWEMIYSTLKNIVDWPVYIMPVGATLEEQENIQEKVCTMAMDRGYNFSSRVHCAVFGNKIGT